MRKISTRNRLEVSVAPLQRRREAEGIEKQLQLEARNEAIRRWAHAKAKGKPAS